MKDPEPTPGNAGSSQGIGKQQPTPPGASPEPQPPAPKPSGRTRMIAFAVFVVLLIGALVLGFIPRWHQREVAAADTSELAITTVSVVSPKPGKEETSLMLPAEVQPWRLAAVYAQASGYLKDWLTDIGAHVQAGQLMADIETPNLNEELQEARAQLDLAQANLRLAIITDERWQTLLKTKSVSVQEAVVKSAAREAASASVKAAQANVQRLQDLVAFQRVVAPFAGVVTLRNVDIGDLIVAGAGGKELFQVAQADKLRAYIRVPEPYAGGVTTGEIGTLTTPETPGITFTGKVITTSEAISPLSRTLETELEVDNQENKILPYSFGEVTLKTDTKHPLLTLPANAILFRAQGLQVGVVLPDNTVELRSVQIGRDFGTTIEILGGVSRTDRVIENPSESLVSGIKVRIQNSTAEK
jgi:membrane fusion protein, multidrug efflux system